MTPFREPPKVELGPLSVGLGRATARVLAARLPSGGRLVKQGAVLRDPHERGALGCIGFVMAAIAAFVALTTGWLPRTHMDIALVAAVVIVAGASLAAVITALDRVRAPVTYEGEVVGRAARRIVRRIARIAALAENDGAHLGPRHVAALRRALSAAADPALSSWIPEDVRGRTELLLARAIAREAGTHFPRDAAVAAEVRSLLVRAADHLEDPRGARLDVAALDASPVKARASQKPRRFAPLPLAAEDEDAAEREGFGEEEAALRRQTKAPRLGVIR
jgi:hypothetical protein